MLKFHDLDHILPISTSTKVLKTTNKTYKINIKKKLYHEIKNEALSSRIMPTKPSLLSDFTYYSYSFYHEHPDILTQTNIVCCVFP